MKSEIIKQQLIEKIADRAVVAAAFYTFNFQPDFFENYVLPVLVPNVEFKNSRLYNAILWRKTNLPPTVVYYDDGIQKMPDSQAPLQDYEICPVRMKKFFHPKANFILVRDLKDESLSLITVLGSHNLTRAGWCENLEASAILEINKETDLSPVFIQSLVDFITQNRVNYGREGQVEAQLVSFLNQVVSKEKTAGVTLYQSWQGGFQSFLNENIFKRDTIERIEILSPFFQKKIDEQTPISLLKKYVDVPIHCLIPFRHGVKIQLEKEVFENYSDTGVIWCDYHQDNTEKEAFSERYNHSKIYRFKGEKACYTVIGSVNFTTNAWTAIEENGNMETAVLFEETSSFNCLLNPVAVSSEWLFLEDNEQQEEETDTFFRKSPDFEFVLDWQLRTLAFKPSDKIGSRLFKLDLIDEKVSLKEKVMFNLSKSAYESFAKNPTVKVEEITAEKVYEHFYYPHQLGIAQRPFLVKFPFKDIRALWKLLRSEAVDEVVTKTLERLVDRYEKADGTVNQILVQEGIINKMATHIDTLVELEQNLFQLNATEDQLREVLVQDVFGSIPYYKRVCILEDEELNKGFAWMLLNILKNQFYSNKQHPAWIAIKPSLKPVISQLDKDINDLKAELEIDKEHLEWALKMIKN